MFKISRMMEDIGNYYFIEYFIFLVLTFLFNIIITHKTLSTIKIIETILVEFFFFVIGPLIRFRLTSPLLTWTFSFL
jgi:hypothetical protein